MSHLATTLSLVVTNYRTWDLATKCASEARRLEPELDEVVIVDDASEEDSPAPIRGDVTLERNERRMGLVRSLDAALRRRTSDIVVVFDSDACPLTPFAQALRLAFAREPRLAVVGFRTVDRDGRTTGSAESEPGVSSLVLGQRLDGVLGPLLSFGRRRRTSVYACAMAVRMEFFRQAGGFDLALDWLDLDHDLCMKAWEQGWTVKQATDLVALHEGGGAPQSTSERVRRFHRSRWRLLSHHHRIRRPRLVANLLRARLSAEILILGMLEATAGRRRSYWREKAEGRRQILADLESGYV